MGYDSRSVVSIAAALADVDAAIFEYENARGWLRSVAPTFTEPLAVEAWVLDPALRQVLLVQHRWRGWVPPGGAAKAGEAPRAAAERELFEETGIEAELLPEPAAVTVRSYHPDWPLTLGISYAVVVDPGGPLASEAGQPAAWLALDSTWASSFGDDRERIRVYADWLAHRL